MSDRDDHDADYERGDARCSCCGKMVTPKQNSILWWIPLMAAWGGLVTGGPLIAVMPPLNMAMIPGFILAGPPILAYLAEKVNGDAYCPACGKLMPEYCRGANAA